VDHSYYDRLVRSVQDEDQGVFVTRDDGCLLLAEYRGERFDPPLLFDFTAEELEVAVRAAGPLGRTLRPDAPEPEGGFGLVLVHLDESLRSGRPTRRVYVADGQIWAE
jgi:hypothetical protein